MMYPSPEKLDIMLKLVARREKGEIADEEWARKMLAVDPGNAPALLQLAWVAVDNGDFARAEELVWQALSQAPLGYQAYLSAGGILGSIEKKSLAERVLHLAVWKISLSDEVDPQVVAQFKATFKKAKLARDPYSYELLAEAGEAELAKEPTPPEIEELLRPYRLLNDIQRFADEGLDEDTLSEVIRFGPACAPVFHAALKELFFTGGPESLKDPTAQILIAILGEIGGPEIISDLLEVVDSPEDAESRHVHWALWRLGQRHPADALRTMSAAIGKEEMAMQLLLAAQMSVLPATPGLADALVSLLDGFRSVAKKPGAGELLATVVDALIANAEDERATALLREFTRLLPAKSRRWIGEIFEGDQEFSSLLIRLAIPTLDIDDVCLGRALMDEELEDEEFEDFEDDVFGEEDELGFDLKPDPPSMPKLGRNDPCWCGSGKKFKKCHLDADQAGTAASPSPMKARALQMSGSRAVERPPLTEAEREILAQIKADHYRNWHDHPLPALNGKTARQAIKTKAGREAVLALIRDMERDEERMCSHGEPKFDFNLVRVALGLKPE